MALDFMGNVIDTGGAMAFDAGVAGADVVGQNMADIGQNALATTVPADPSMMENIWGGMKDTGNFLTGNNMTNALKTGIAGYGAYNQNKLGRGMLSNQNQQLAMAQDAYDRNVDADKARTELTF